MKKHYYVLLIAVCLLSVQVSGQLSKSSSPRFLAEIDPSSCDEYVHILKENFNLMESNLDSAQFRNDFIKENLNDSQGLSAWQIFDLIQEKRQSHTVRFKVYCYDARSWKSIVKLNLQSVSDVREKQLAAFVKVGKSAIYINTYQISEMMYELEPLRLSSPKDYHHALTHNYGLVGRLAHEIMHLPDFNFDHPYEQGFNDPFFPEPYYQTVPVVIGTIMREASANRDSYKSTKILVRARQLN